MLKRGLIRKKPARIGAQQQFCMTKKDFALNDNSAEVLHPVNYKHFTKEKGKYDLEINSEPSILGNYCISKLSV
jgi:hypothetical protein